MNDPIIHARLSKIVEAIRNQILESYFNHKCPTDLGRHIMVADYTITRNITTALASLESSEREVSNQAIIDATNTIRFVLNNWQDAFAYDFIKAEDALDFIQRSIPSEREVLEGFVEMIKNEFSELNLYYLDFVIDRYLAEKGVKND